ncbi:unnamed protein product [Symbiodinium pilosum]|uniref:Uncharacterized protein n=1 Tax=Symbiodinium pilosum TaxID=2952 RepID=A0A812K9C0_SYMPI|nr:unnamed protein product [Symbiodinium pilosum]
MKNSSQTIRRNVSISMISWKRQRPRPRIKACRWVMKWWQRTRKSKVHTCGCLTYFMLSGVWMQVSGTHAVHYHMFWGQGHGVTLPRRV